MSNKTVGILLFGIWLMVSLACTSTTSSNYNGLTGSASESMTTCHNSGNTGQCTGEINTLTGTYYKDITNDVFKLAYKNADVTVKVTLGSGSARVYLLDGDGQQIKMDLNGGDTSSIQGQTPITNNRFKVFFQSTGDKVENLDYTISYSANR